MNITNEDRLDMFEETRLRICGFVDLASVVATRELEGSLDGPLESLLEEVIATHDSVHPSLAPIKQALFGEVEPDFGWRFVVNKGTEQLLEQGVLGFAIQVATPICTYTRETSFSYSWGCTYRRWIYADCLEAAMRTAITWAQEQNEADKTRTLTKAEV